LQFDLEDTQNQLHKEKGKNRELENQIQQLEANFQESQGDMRKQ